MSFLITLGIFIILSIALSELNRPKRREENSRPATLSDFNFPTATQGRVVPLLWGRCLIKAPNVTWYGNLRQDAITERVKTGMFSSDSITKGFRYFVGMQFTLCRGFDAIRNIYVGEELLWSGNQGAGTIDISSPGFFGGDDYGQGGIIASLDVFTGAAGQPASDYLSKFLSFTQQNGSVVTPRYKGNGYLMFRQFGVAAADANGGYIGNSTSIKPWWFEVERYPDLFGSQSGSDNKVGSEANPVNVLYEYLTNPEWGRSIPPANINITNFETVAATLASEGNGFSMLLDRPIEGTEFVRELERHIDGRIFLDHTDGKWRIKLARGDYSIGSVPQLDDDNTEVTSYDRGTWVGSTNQMRVLFADRNNLYQEVPAFAQDIANALIQGGGTPTTLVPVVAETRYPGCKTAALANKFAARDLRTASYPLAKATFKVDRSFWNLKVGDVVAWTSSQYGVTQVPMRIGTIDYGRLSENVITLKAVQDIFEFTPPWYADPPGSDWDAPDSDLQAYPTDEQLAFEAPRALVTRDPQFGGDANVSKVFAAARRQAGEVVFEIRQRNAAGSPSGAYASSGDVIQFMRIGSLAGTLSAGTALPISTITITPSPDSQVSLEEVFDDSTPVETLGVELTHLILINNEFMLVSSASNNGANVDLEDVYRGVLDSTQAEHTTGDDVYLIFVGAGLSEDSFATTNNIDVKLIPKSSQDELSEASATAISFQFAKRTIRPYPPADVSINTTRYPQTPNLEGNGSGLSYDLDFTWKRRRYDLTDEIAALSSDDSGVDASTEYQVELRADPDSTDVLVDPGASAYATGTGPVTFTRTDILAASPNGAAGAELRVIVRTRHDILSETNLASRQNLQFDFTPTSALTSQFALGALGSGTDSADYTAAATGTFTVNLENSIAGNVEYRLNGGSWTNVITSGGTTGTFGATSGDTIELRQTAAAAANTFVELQDPGSSPVAYGVFTP